MNICGTYTNLIFRFYGNLLLMLLFCAHYNAWKGAVLPVFWKQYGALSDRCSATPIQCHQSKTASVPTSLSNC
jgi:hypothetical protein